MDGVEFVVGPFSVAMAKLLAMGTGAYAIATFGHAREGMRGRLPDRWSAMATTGVMVALTVLLWRDGGRLLPAPYSFAVLAMFMAGILITLGYTLSNAQRRLEELRAEMARVLDEWSSKHLPPDRREAWLEARRRLSLGDEGRRKTPHLMSGILLFVYLVAGHVILRGAQRLSGGTEEVRQNLAIAVDAGWLVSGHMVSLVLILGMVYLVLPVEFVRLKFPELGYPFKGTITGTLREREKGLFGAHYYIAASVGLAVLWMGSEPDRWHTTLPAIIAMVCVTVFADAASALFGVRYGRTRLPHNPGKTWVGSAGGTAVAFIVAVPFVGVPVGAAAALVFLVLDLLAPVPIDVSDNILNPIGLAAAFLLLDPWVAPMLPFY